MPRRKRTLPPVTHALAARHEALWLKLTSLQAQIAPVAARRPQGVVSAHTGMVAEGLLREALPFLIDGNPLPVAAPDYGGLATQLGQALAGLEAWEAANMVWRGDLNAFVWTVSSDTALPVARLRPKLVPPAKQDLAYAAGLRNLRDKLAQHIDQFKRR